MLTKVYEFLYQKVKCHTMSDIVRVNFVLSKYPWLVFIRITVALGTGEKKKIANLNLNIQYSCCTICKAQQA